MSRPESVIALPVVFQTLLTTSAFADYYYFKERAPCISMPNLPGHGSLTFRGFFVLNLVCPGDDEDIPANAPGNPPGVLYCDQNMPNTEISRLRIPKCIPMKQEGNVIEMVMTFAFTYQERYCPIPWAYAEITHKFMLQLLPLIANDHVCPKCEITTKVRIPWCGILVTGKMMIKVPVGLLTTYNKSISNHVYDKMWQNITATVDEWRPRINDTKTVWELQRVDYEPWTAVCDHIPHSLPTILSLQNTVSCRGCSDSHYADPYGLNRCLQCPFGYWIRKENPSPNDNFSIYNAPQDCVKCPLPQEFNSRVEFLRLCFERY